jgi:hypothetical protein
VKLGNGYQSVSMLEGGEGGEEGWELHLGEEVMSPPSKTRAISLTDLPKIARDHQDAVARWTCPR